MIYNNLLDLIGNTPVVKVDFKDENIADVYVKLEKFNLSGSVKDRAALGMIEAAEKEGLLKEGSVIIEPTSGNTGIALALIGRLKGYKVIIVNSHYFFFRPIMTGFGIATATRMLIFAHSSFLYFGGKDTKQLTIDN